MLPINPLRKFPDTVTQADGDETVIEEVETPIADEKEKDVYANPLGEEGPITPEATVDALPSFNEEESVDPGLAGWLDLLGVCQNF